MHKRSRVSAFARGYVARERLLWYYNCRFKALREGRLLNPSRKDLEELELRHARDMEELRDKE